MARSTEIEAFVSRYSDEIAAQLRRARAELRRLIPNGCDALAARRLGRREIVRSPRPGALPAASPSRRQNLTRNISATAKGAP